MSSVFRGVALSALGALLCAGLVFTADRSLSSSGKRDNARSVTTTFTGEQTRPIHPTRVQTVDRDEVMDFLFAGYARAGVSTAAELTAHSLVLQAEDLVGKDNDAAIRLLQQVAELELPSSEAATDLSVRADLLLGQLHTKQDGRHALKAAGYYERAATRMDLNEDRDDVLSAFEMAANLYEQAGVTSDATRVRRQTDAIERGLSSFSMIQDRFEAARTMDPGPDDFCDGAVDLGTAGLLTETMTISPAGDHNWRLFSTDGPGGTAGSQVSIGTGAGPTTIGDDTDLTLYGGCDAGLPTDFIAFDDDSGEGFFSQIDVCLANGSYYLEVGGWADATSVFDFELTIEDTGDCFIAAPDEFEPDDQIGQALLPQIGCSSLDMPDMMQMGGGGDDDSSDEDEDEGMDPVEICEELQTQCRTIAPAGDIDFATFNLGSDEGRFVTVSTGQSDECGGATEPPPVLVQAMTDDWGSLFYATAAPTIGLCLPGGSDFNVFVASLDATATFPYELTVDATAPCDFESEPNSTCEEANDLGGVLADGTLVSRGAIHTPFQDPFGAPFFSAISDQDWFTFTLAEPCTISIETTAPTGDGRVDTELELYDGCPDAGGNSIAFDDDGGSVFWTSAIETTLAAGTYYVRATESAVFGPGLPYVYGLDVRCVPPPEDDQEPNDDACAPFDLGELAGMVTLEAAIFPSTDQDYFGFSLSADSIVSVTTTGPISGEDTTVNISYDTAPPNCSLLNICCDDDSGFGPGPFFSFLDVCLPPGDYVVGVQSFNQLSQLEDYTITFSNDGPCFADSTPENNVCSGDEGFGCPF